MGYRYYLLIVVWFSFCGPDITVKYESVKVQCYESEHARCHADRVGKIGEKLFLLISENIACGSCDPEGSVYLVAYDVDDNGQFLNPIRLLESSYIHLLFGSDHVLGCATCTSESRFKIYELNDSGDIVQYFVDFPDAIDTSKGIDPVGIIGRMFVTVAHLTGDGNFVVGVDYTDPEKPIVKKISGLSTRKPAHTALAHMTESFDSSGSAIASFFGRYNHSKKVNESLVTFSPKVGGFYWLNLNNLTTNKAGAFGLRHHPERCCGDSLIYIQSFKSGILLSDEFEKIRVFEKRGNGGDQRLTEKEFGKKNLGEYGNSRIAAFGKRIFWGAEDDACEISKTDYKCDEDITVKNEITHNDMKNSIVPLFDTVKINNAYYGLDYLSLIKVTIKDNED